MAERVFASRRRGGDHGWLQRKAPLRVGAPDDAYEREADRLADAVTRGRSASPSGLSVSRLPLAQVQRDDAKPKSEEEKYKEAAQKLGEAFLETEIGKKLREKAEQDPLVKGAKEAGESFIGTLPGKVITGAAAVGAVSALAAAHKELPAQLPEIPLYKITPGLKVKLTYEGPVDKPTKAMITFSYTEQIARGKRPATTRAEIQREENARMAAELARFRAGLRYAPGTPEAKRQQEEEEALKRAAFSRVGALPELGKVRTFPGLAPTPGYGFKLKPLSLLDEELKLKPLEEAGEAKEPEKKKEEGAAVRRKATADHAAAGAPAIVRDALQESGRPLDSATRADMEQRFGCDFGVVRVHTDAHAERSARAVSARAYTFGSEVVFAAGEYSPYSAEGRRLLAHELAHVVQQQARSDAASAAPALRRKVDERLQSPAEALREALRGDDDDVRGLTKASQWPSVQFTAEEAAALLVLLLVGATLDDDEIAGLAVLRKALALGLFDDTLGKLNDKRRFRQLLDDYHGAEYRLLLELLSNHIERLNIKAVYLDAFIAMWWVREHEERAIVVLLERTSANDLFALLGKNNRQKELRDAIDTATLSVRYEKVAGKVNELRQADLAAQLKKIFDAKAKKSQAAGKRTPDEINRLLADAANDLTSELLDYRDRLRKALAAPKADADAIAEINKDFEARLGFLLERKQAEFDLELKYDVEFDRLLRDARGRSWTLADLKQIDKILAQIPPEILSANPKFRAILRAGEDPKLAGQAPWSGETIKLFGSLALGTTAHELGHVISYDDGEKLQKEFNKQFGWEELTAADFTRLVPERKEREKLLRDLEDDRAKEREAKNDRHAYGNHFYRYNRYDKRGYLRHPKDACFISDYAATDRYDDFAESFEAYLTDPANLHDTCAGKYAFMRGKVFVRYFFGKLAAGVLSDFDKERDDGLKALVLPAGLPEALRNGHLRKLREALQEEIDATAGRLETRALGEKPSAKMKRVPLTGTEARDAAKPYRQRLTDLLGLLAHVVKPWQAFSSEADRFVAAAPSKYDISARLLRIGLVKSFREDALALIDPNALRILAGDHIQLPAWPQMDALAVKYRKAVDVAAKYLPTYETSLGEEFTVTPAAFASTEAEEVGATAWKILRRYRQGDPRRQKLKDYVLQQRAELEKQAEKLRSDILEQVKAGVPPKQAKLTTPESLLKTYERDIRAFIKREGLQLQRQTDPAARNGAAPAPLVAEPLQGAGMTLPRHVRAEMELRFGYDFSRVRVHADGRGAAAAKAAGALAYTVGNHVVFAAGQYQPLRRTGRRLLAHELTHVVQQGAASALGHAAAGQERQPRLQRDAAVGAEQAGPAVDREMVDLPELFEEEAAAEPQAAPPAAMPETRLPVVPPEHASEREASEIAERIVRGPAEESLPAVAERLAPGAVSRDNVPKPGQPVRKDIAFVMGSDKPKSKNRFYTAAKKYFKANLAGVELIDDPKIRDLAAVFSYLAKRGEALGTLYIISHAADDGTLSFPLQPGDKDRKVDYRELRDALKTSPALFKLPAGVVDKSTTIRIKGCRLGQSQRMLGAIGAAFGAGRVVAPKHRQYYEYETAVRGKGKGRKVEEATYEGFRTYFIERRGELKLTRDEQLDAFASKYANLSRADWETLVPKKGSKVARKVERRKAISFSFTDPADDKQALAQARKDFAASKENFVPAKVVGSAATAKPFAITLSDGSKKTFKGKAVQYSFEDAKGDTGYLTYDVPTDEKEIVDAAKADESVPEAYDWRLQKARRGATVTYTALGIRTVYSLERYIAARLGKEPEKKRLYAPPEAAPEYYGEAPPKP